MEENNEREYEYGTTHRPLEFGTTQSGVEDDGTTRSYIFNSFGLIGGLAALVWAAWTLHLYRRSGGKHSIFIITLLFIDALELSYYIIFPWPLSSVWHRFEFCVVLRLVSMCLHQLVALEGVASVTHPHFAVVFSSLPCSVSLTLITVTLVIFIKSSRAFDIPYSVYFLTVTTAVPVLTHAVMCFLICSKAKPHQASRRGITEKTVLFEALVSYIVLHGPCLLAGTMYLIIVGGHGLDWCLFLHNMFFTVSSLWVMADCLLVALVCRLPRVQYP